MGEQVKGVPRAEAQATDHIQVRAKLVKRLGGANQALVWSRIYYRADEQHRAAVEADGLWWWPASYPKLAEETGLTEKQALDAVLDLIENGYVQRQPVGKSFRYRPVMADESYLPHRSDSDAAVSDPQDRSIRPAGQTYLPSGSVAPLIDKEDVLDTPVVPIADAVQIAFDQVWSSWPTTRRGSRKKAESSWRTAVKTLGRGRVTALVQRAGAFCEAWATWIPDDLRYVPMLATWLNQERWTTPLPERNRGRSTSPSERAMATLALADSPQQAVSA